MAAAIYPELRLLIDGTWRKGSDEVSETVPNAATKDRSLRFRVYLPRN